MIYFNGVEGDDYFEGWFFRIRGEGFNCALIPSISVSNGKKKAYLQINVDGESRVREFDFAQLSATDDAVVIDGNCFSDKGVNVACANLELNVDFDEFLTLDKDIMGCFKHGTPCKHKVISMRHGVHGCAVLDGREITLTNAVGYIEKDWGASFPKAYCWIQCNDFAEEEDAAFFFSAAKLNIPITGLICSLVVQGTEYRFATYNLARIKKLRYGDIVLKKGKTVLKISFTEGAAASLLAPARGKMDASVKENLDATVHLTLYEDKKLVYSLSGKNVGVEWVDFPRNE